MICSPAMDAPNPDLLRRIAALAGQSWTAEDVAAMAPLVTRTLRLLARLDSMSLGDVEPCVQFQVD